MDQRIWEVLEVEEDCVTLRDQDDWGHLMLVYPDGTESEFCF